MRDAAELDRYHRQMRLPGIGEDGQRRLLAAHAVIVGCGALGCVTADLLCRAGVGTLTIIDRDVVELTNLQRQSLFDEKDALSGAPKAEAARQRLNAVNSQVRVRSVVADFTHRNAEQLLAQAQRESGVGVLIDGTDNFETRYLLNDLSVKHAIPYCYAGAVAAEGMSATFMPGTGGACLRCVFEELPAPGTFETCDTAGVLGPSVAIVGACQAADAIKILSGQPERVSASLLHFDLWRSLRRRVDLSAARRSDCACCGRGAFEFLEGRHASRTIRLCGQNAVQIAPPDDSSIVNVELSTLAARLRPLSLSVVENGFLVRAAIPGALGDGQSVELTVFGDGRAVIKGTEDPVTAKIIYARYIGS